MKYITILILLVFWKFFSVTNNVANDFSFLSRSELVSRFSFPQIWQERISEGLGQYSLAILWNWPMDLLYGLLGKIGLSFSLIQILVFLIPFVFVGYRSLKRFLYYFGVDGWGSEIGVLFYLINPYVILLIDGGQLSIALAYAFLPIVLVNFVEALVGSFRAKTKAGLAFSILGFLDIRYLYLLVILLLFYFVYEIIKSRKIFAAYLKSWIYTGIVVLTIFLILNAYWIIPSIISRAPALPPGYSDVTQVTNLSFTNWKHALLLHPSGWFKNVFGEVAIINKEFVLIPLLVFLGYIVGAKKKQTYFFVILSIIGIFLVKGSNTPFPNIYPYLFQNVPGFSLFRDSTKFFVFIALGYTYFIGVLVNEVSNIKKNNLIRLASFGFIICYLIFLVRPVWLGRMTGTLSQSANESEFTKVWKQLEIDNNFGRVMWLPAQPPFGYSSPLHPSIEISRLFSKRPFVTGVVGGYETNNFLREATYMGELFDVLGIKYIAYPYPDTRREVLKQDNIDYYYAFLDQLTNIPWIGKRLTESPVPLLQTKNTQDKFFVADNTYAVIGDESIYENFGEKNLIKLKDTALIFIEESPDLASDLPNYAKFILNGKQDLDLKMTRVPKGNFISPAENLPYSPDLTAWHCLDKATCSDGGWKRESIDFLWMRNFLQQKYGIDNTDFDYGDGYAISEGMHKLQITNIKFRKENNLYVRALVSIKGGLIEFYQGNIKIGVVDTKKETPQKVGIKLTGYKEIPDQFFEYDKADFKWFEVGTLLEDGGLVVKTDGEINIVNSLVSINTNEMNKLEDIPIDSYKYSDSSLFLGESMARVSYERLAPTHYKVKVSGLTKPSTLVFSETYDPLWRIYDHEGNEGKPYKLYSLINGFNVEKDGEYDIYFAPQKYVNYGFIISILGFVSIISYLFNRPARQDELSNKRH